jgi:hypothetical protein
MSSRKQAFLVKLWVTDEGTTDAASPVPGGARGSVEHLESKRRLYFSEIAQLVAFLTTNADTTKSR